MWKHLMLCAAAVALCVAGIPTSTHAQEIDVSPVSLEEGFDRLNVTLTGSYDVLGGFVTLAPSVGHQIDAGRYFVAIGPRINVGGFHASVQLSHNLFNDAPDGEGIDIDPTAFGVLATVGYAVLGPFGVVLRSDIPLGDFAELDYGDRITAGVFLRL